MPNNYFQFKQFIIYQDRVAMKVTTDACLFGALVAGMLPRSGPCLDIGTGTGLLSLMYAQKNPQSVIDAVELNAGAAEQAKANIENSPWAGKISVFNNDILDFDAGKKYDLVFSNPPFFENDLRSPHPAKNSAKHDTNLNLENLLLFVDGCLAEGGSFAVLLPVQRVKYFIEQAAGAGLKPFKQIFVKQSPAHAFFREILFFSKKNVLLQQEAISIRDSGGKYSAAFSSLLEDYYLHP